MALDFVESEKGNEWHNGVLHKKGGKITWKCGAYSGKNVKLCYEKAQEDEVLWLRILVSLCCKWI